MLLKCHVINIAYKATILNKTAVKVSFIVLLEKRKTVQPVLYCSNVYISN